MFRKLARANQALPPEECLEILERELRGVLSVLGDDDYPYGMPLNHYYCREDGKLYFHGGMKGHRVDAVRRHDKVSFCVMDQGFRREGEWALNIKSVIVFGRMEEVTDREKCDEIYRLLSRKFIIDDEYTQEEIRRSGPHTMLLALVPEHITGKIVKER